MPLTKPTLNVGIAGAAAHGALWLPAAGARSRAPRSGNTLETVPGEGSRCEGFWGVLSARLHADVIHEGGLGARLRGVPAPDSAQFRGDLRPVPVRVVAASRADDL